MTHHIFGPVVSRRLGRSLGIDLLPFKTCTYNCVYCECGPTTTHSGRREEFFPVQEIISELDCVLSKKPELDYITFAGSGEPTLSLLIGRVISYLKEKYPDYKVAVLTNGSLLSLNEVRMELMQADLVIPTLSTASQEMFERIHRPVQGLSVKTIIEGIGALREEFSNQIWLEVFLVPPLNTTDNELSNLRDAIYTIRPDRIQVNTLDRPGTESWVRTPDPEETEKITEFLSGGVIPVDIIGKETDTSHELYSDEISLHIEETLSRRPCTAEDITHMTGLHMNEVMKKLGCLIRQGVVQSKQGERGIFYSIIRCIFCSPDANVVILRNEYAYCRLDDYPVTPGHLLIIPFRHVSSFFAITEAEQTAMWDLVRLGKHYLDRFYHPEGYNIGINDGIVAGQTVMHLHIHLIPRYPGDIDDPKGWVHRILKVSETMLELKDYPSSQKN